ncbi:MAG: hypothetical protein IRZ06_10180 [Nevskia sp.]|nr:hypothetical protein [Nevskia sp.]
MIVQAVTRLQGKYAARDARMRAVKMVREGNIHLLFPDAFSDSWPQAITANFVDAAARDIAEAIATLPTLTCPTGRNDASARAYAAKKAKAGVAYWRASKLRQQFVTAADYFVSYGFAPVIVEVDYDRHLPMLRFEDPMMAYPEFDRWGRVVRYVKIFEEMRSTLAAMFPEYESQLLRDDSGQMVPDGTIRLIRYMDAQRTVLYVPALRNAVLVDVENPISRCPVAVARRPGLDWNTRGQFDDVIWIQLARNRLAMLRMEAAEDAVGAPLAVPMDAQDLPIGPYAVIQSNDPRSVHRVNLEIPQSVFAQDAMLDQELRMGSRYPDSRAGNVRANIITGRGIEALQAGFDTQIQTAQTQLGEALAEATSIAFEFDDKLFGDFERRLTGFENGAPYEIRWKPSRDLRGDYSCEVTYGFYAGQSLPQAIVTMLQLRADRDMSRDTLMRNIPWDIDVEEELRNIDVEDLRQTLKNAIAATSGAIPQLVAAGGDPTHIISAVAEFITLRGKGVSPEEAAMKVFTPQQQPQEAAGAASGPPGEAAGGEAGGGPFGGPGGPQAPLQPGESQFRPDMLSMLASLAANGRANAEVSTRRARVM